MPTETSARTWTLIALLTASVAGMAFTAPRPELWEGFVGASFAAAALCGFIWRRGDVGMRAVIGFALLFRLALVWLPPVLSDDAFRYVWDGLLQREGINPYLHVPAASALAEFQAEPMFAELNSASYYSVYPPVSQLIFRVGAFFYDGGWEVSYYVIKAIFATLEFGAVLMLARLVGPSALILYAWNPLVLIAGAGQAHGEAALAFFFSLALLAARKGSGGWAAVWLACAGWVKLYPFLLFPFLFRRFGWKSVLAGAAAAGALALPYFDPRVVPKVMSSLDLYVRLFEFNAGFYYAVKHAFYVFTGADWSKQIGPALRIVFLTVVLVLYYVDWSHPWSLRRTFVVAVGAFFVFATTVHPWYLVGILVLVVPARRPSWHWLWLGVISIGTYLLYVGGPYWTWVHLAWGGWALLAAIRYRQALLEVLLRVRARGKARALVPLLHDNLRILDIGAAEGYVGAELVRRIGAHVHLVDVVDQNRTDLPYRTYDGATLPYADDAFDTSLLVYVLHHVHNPQAVLEEAVRTAGRSVVILESTYGRSWERPILERIDRWVNRVRSGRHVSFWKGPLNIRRAEEWRALFHGMGLHVSDERDLGGFIHHRVVFVLDASSGGSSPHSATD